MTLPVKLTVFHWQFSHVSDPRNRSGIFFRVPAGWQTSSSSPDFKVSTPIQDKSRDFRSSPSQRIVTKNLKEETDFRDLLIHHCAGLHSDWFIPDRNNQEEKNINKP